MYTQIAANKRKTLLLMLSFVFFVGLIGYIFSRAYEAPSLATAVIIGALVYAVIGYFASAKIALAMTGAKPIEQKDNPRLYRIVENLSITAGLPMPKVYIIDDPAPNAFATGRKPDKAVVAATTGILDMLDDPELEGVMAHEMSHVGNYDIRLMGIVLVLVSVIAIVSDIFIRMTWFSDNRREGNNQIFIILGIVAAILAPLVATLLKLAVSRKREYLADASGALLTRYPAGLASALRKIDSYKHPMKRAGSSTAHLFFSNPLKKGDKQAGFATLFSTHPPAAERIARLEQMGRHE